MLSPKNAGRIATMVASPYPETMPKSRGIMNECDDCMLAQVNAKSDRGRHRLRGRVLCPDCVDGAPEFNIMPRLRESPEHFFQRKT